MSAAVRHEWIPAFQKQEALIAEVRGISAEDPDLHLWWLGQSGFLCKQAGATLLFDPYLSDSLTKKYAQTDKPHTRISELCLDPALLSGVVELVTASHLHTDHLDAETLLPLSTNKSGVDLVLPYPILAEARQRLAGGNIRYHCLNENESIALHGWRITGVTAAHNDLKRDDEGRCFYLGFIAERGDFTLYHSGDTLKHEEMDGILSRFQCDGMLLPINGNKPERRVAGNLNGAEAAQLAARHGARLVIPCHYDLFAFNTESPSVFVQTCEDLSQPYQVLRIGEKTTLKRIKA